MTELNQEEFFKLLPKLTDEDLLEIFREVDRVIYTRGRFLIEWSIKPKQPEKVNL